MAMIRWKARAPPQARGAVAGTRYLGRARRAAGRVLLDDARDLRVGLVAVLGEHVGLVDAVLHAAELAAALVLDVDVDLHRQADAQRMPFEFLRVQRDAHRQALQPP
ncbi:hypothetical protein [Burkholderia gladioli]|uniref:hypothetical protein n=1 Tax=Burkholderia gladioli TaxID=28095 RepID=UPI003D22A860